MASGRLTVDHRRYRHAIGPALLLGAMQRTLDISRSAGVCMLRVHAIDDDALAFYLRYVFRHFPAGSQTMFLAVETTDAAV